MSQLIHKNIPTHISIWKIEEELDELYLMSSLDEIELKIFHSFHSEKRKKEFLSSRILLNLKKLGNSSIHYDFNRAPFFPYLNKSISISHSNGYVAISLKKKNELNGLDLELPNDKLIKTKSKFIHIEEENKFETSNLNLLTLIWSAKECMYKMFPEQSLNLKDEIYIEEISDKEILVTNRKEAKQYLLHFFCFEGIYGVWY